MQHIRNVLMVLLLCPAVWGCAGGPVYTFENAHEAYGESAVGIVGRGPMPAVDERAITHGFYVVLIDGVPKNRHPRVGAGKSGELAFLPGKYELEVGLLAFIPGYVNRYGRSFTLQIVSAETVKIPLSVEAGDRFALRTLIHGKTDIDETRALDGVPIDIDWSAVLYDRNRGKVVLRVRKGQRAVRRN